MKTGLNRGCRNEPANLSIAVKNKLFKMFITC